MAKWIRAGKTVSAEGTTIEYQMTSADVPYTVESRKRHIPHSNRPGTWDHTSYYVMKDEEEITQRYSLRSAQEYVERLLDREGDESDDGRNQAG